MTLRFISILFLALTSLAEVYQFNYSLPWGGPPITLRNYAGVTEKIVGIYNTTDNHFEWEVEFSPAPASEPFPGVLPNSFWLVLNNGPMPKHTSQGEVPIIHFDGTDPLNPVLSVYAYAGSNSGSSWRDGSNLAGIQDADRILSNIAPVGIRNPSGWVKELLVQDISPDRRKFRFAIDATAIQNHIPKYGSTDTPGCDVNPALCWEGLRFGPFGGDSMNPAGNYIGVWMHPFADLTSDYYEVGDPVDPDKFGFLSAWNVIGDKHGWFDTGMKYPPVRIVKPACKIDDLHFTLTEGVPFQHSIRVADPAGGGLTVNYSGFPPAMTFDPTEGGTIQNGEQILYNWTPGQSDVGIFYDIITKLTDKWGTEAECSFSVETEPNEPPEGEFDGEIPPLPCSDPRVSQTLTLLVTDDGVPNNILNYQWSSTCPNATFSDSGGTVQGSQATLQTSITFDAETNGLPSSCTVTANVSDGLKSKDFTVLLTVEQCQKDCAGTINGNAQFDICGVCEGDGTSCLDCEGTPFGSVKIDRCGVCGGNGNSCLGCEPYNVSDILGSLDSRANQQARLITRISKLIRKAPESSAKSKKIASVAILEAKKLELLQWQSLWINYGATGQICQNSSFCVSSSNVEVLSGVGATSETFRKTTKRLISRTARDGTASSSKRAKWAKTNKRLHNQNIAELSSLPSAKSLCSDESF